MESRTLCLVFLLQIDSENYPSRMYYDSNTETFSVECLECHFLFDPARALEVFLFGIACPHERIYIYKNCRHHRRDHYFLYQTSFTACIRHGNNYYL